MMTYSKFFILIVWTRSIFGHSSVQHECPGDQVYAITAISSQAINISCIKPPICGETRTCAYNVGAKPACTGLGEYLAGVDYGGGHSRFGCCQYTPPVQQHSGDACQQQIFEVTSVNTVSHPSSPFTHGNSHGGGGGGGAGAGHNDDREVDIILSNNHGPGNPAQLVKAITPIGTAGHEGYTVTVCTPTCGTTTKHPSTPSQQPTQPTHQPQHEEKHSLFHHNGEGGGHHCFSSDMTVKTPSGTKQMDELHVGDLVLVSSVDAQPIFEPIEWLYHRNPDAVAEFITVTTKSNRILRLSPNHLIPFVPCSILQLRNQSLAELADAQSYFARRLKIGNCVAAVIDNEILADEIVHIAREQKRGIFSPITSRGTIIVNNLFVSCYSSVENHLVQKTVHSNLIKMRHILSSTWNFVFGNGLKKEEKDLPDVLKMLLSMTQFLLPINVYSGY